MTKTGHSPKITYKMPFDILRLREAEIIGLLTVASPVPH